MSRTLLSRHRPLAAIAAIAALALAALSAGSAATAQPVTPVQHVVVIYLENQSFDSVLGYWCSDIAGGTITRAMGCTDANGNYVGMPSQVTLSNGTKVTPEVSPDKVPAVNHNTAAQVAAMNIVKGVPQMNGWQNMPAGKNYPGCGASVHYDCISGYQPSQIPNIAALASQFAISDMTFSMNDSPSWEGHMYAVAASTDGFSGGNPFPAPGVTPANSGWGCDSLKVETWYSPLAEYHKSVPSCVPDYSLGLPNGGAFEPTPVPDIPTIMDRLDAAGLPWKIYGATMGEQGYGVWDICPTFAGCLDTSQDANLVDDSQFLSDAAAGTLPAFSVVTPGGADFPNSCHNYESMANCDTWAGQLVQAAESGPEWSSTAVFITWDDCGCFYDQVRPPTAGDGTQEGPRVPLIIVSPYAKPGYTDTTAASFASILRFTEENFGLSPLGPDDNYAYDFSGAFDYSQVPLTPAKMAARPYRHLIAPSWLVDDPS